MNPTRLPRALLLILVLSLVLSGCELSAVGESEQIANRETILAGTPSATPSPTITPTLPPSATPTNTVGPSPTPSATPPPSATPLPATPTPNPALVGFSFCGQQAGPATGRFSASLGEISAGGFPAFEQLSVGFTLAEGSAPLSAAASCVRTENLPEIDAASTLTYTLRVDLPGWLRDERFSSSALTETLAFSTTRTIADARWVQTPDEPSGASLLIGLREALPYRLTIERNPLRLVIAVARNSPLVSTSDLLSVAEGRPEPEEPLFMLYDGDIWRVEAGQRQAGPGLTPSGAGATNLSQSADSETAFAVSPDGSTIAFCRAAPGLDPADSGLAVPSALFLMGADGKNVRSLGQAGVSCADPAFSVDGDTIAFAVDETGAVPAQRTIYSVPVRGGQPSRLIAGDDEWSRFAPQWLAGDALVYAAAAQDGRSTLFLRLASGQVLDLGATILVDDARNARYAAIGRPLANRDGTRFAIEAYRVDAPGADTIILAANGDITDILGAQRMIPPPATPTITATQLPTRTAPPTRTSTSAASPGATTPAATPATSATGATGSSTAQPPAAASTGTAGAAQAPSASTGAAGAAQAPSASTGAAGATQAPSASTGAAQAPSAASTGAAQAPSAANTGAAQAPSAASTGAAQTPSAASTGAVPAPSGTPPAPTPEPEPEPTREGPYWTRPLAWTSAGQLIYLSTSCASDLVLDYQIARWVGPRRSEPVGAGLRMGGVGPATSVGDALVYILADQAPAGPLGPAEVAVRSPGALWLWNLASGERGPLLTSERGISALER